MKVAFPGRKDSIILTAIEIISDMGIQGLSTKELAKRQQITESLLYRHFKSKDEIILAVLEHYSRFDASIMNTVLNGTACSKDKIYEFIRLYTEYYENYPAITAILHSYHQLLKDTNTGNMIKDVLQKRNTFLLELIQSGQEKGEISSYYTADELLAIITGFSLTLTLSWRLDGYSFSLKERTMSTLDKLLARN